MAGTGAIGLVAVFAVDLVNLFYISRLGDQAVAAAVGFAGVVGFFQISISIGMTIGVTAVVSRSIGAGTARKRAIWRPRHPARRGARGGGRAGNGRVSGAAAADAWRRRPHARHGRAVPADILAVIAVARGRHVPVRRAACGGRPAPGDERHVAGCGGDGRGRSCADFCLSSRADRSGGHHGGVAAGAAGGRVARRGQVSRAARANPLARRWPATCRRSWRWRGRRC